MKRGFIGWSRSGPPELAKPDNAELGALLRREAQACGYEVLNPSNILLEEAVRTRCKRAAVERAPEADRGAHC